MKRDKYRKDGSVLHFVGLRGTIGGKEACFGMKTHIDPKLWKVKARKAIGKSKEHFFWIGQQTIYEVL